MAVAQPQNQLVAAFDQAVGELVTVEKKNIVVLTEIARDALRTDPQAAPSLAATITSRILQAPAPQKLPVLYLLDSISKLVGEPYKALFAPYLAEAYMSAWQQGGPGLHRSLDKLLATWTGVFPQPLLSDIQSRVAALRAAQAPVQVQLPAVAAAPANGYGGGFDYGAVVPAAAPAPMHVQPQSQPQQMAPMASDPRLAQPLPIAQQQQPPMAQPPPLVQQLPMAQQPLQQQAPLVQQAPMVQRQPQQQLGYGMPQQPAPASRAYGQQPGYGMQQEPVYQQPAMAPAPAFAPFPASAPQQQQPQQQYYQQLPPQHQLQQPYGMLAQQAAPMQQQQLAPPPLPQQQQQPVSVPDLLSSLLNAGLLAPAAGMQQPTTLALAGSGRPPSTPPYAAAVTATPEHEQPASTTFTPERLKEHNPSAVARLLRQTEATKSRFLDRKFLRRQQKQAGAAARASRLWYLDLDTWMASTVGATAAASAGGAAAGTAGQRQAAAAAAAEKHSVPVDDMQTHCALSGEQFEQFWDERHQEWRYKDAKRLDAEEAASYGLEEGAIVLVSALGKPAASTGVSGGISGGGGVLSELQARQEIAADLAAATAVAAAAGGRGEAKDVKAGMKHLLEGGAMPEVAGAGAQAAAEVPPEKRLRVA